MGVLHAVPQLRPATVGRGRAVPPYSPGPAPTISSTGGGSKPSTARIVITRRNRQQRSLSVAAVLVVSGLACYLTAVVIAAVASGTNLTG